MAQSHRTMADDIKDALEAKRASKSDEDALKCFTQLVTGKRQFILACIKYIIKKQTDPEPQAVLIPIKDLDWPTRLMSAKSEENTKFEKFVMDYFQKNEGLEVSFKYPNFYEKNDNPTWLFVLFNGPYTHCTDIVGAAQLSQA